MIRFRAWMFDDWRMPLLGGVLCLTSLSGCALRGNNELLETQLRKQETALQHYASETSRLREELAVSRREMDQLRAEAAAHGEIITPEEQAHRLAKVSGLVFNSLLTAGQSQDDIAGDERFHAVFYPHDADGEVVKLSGQIEVEALDLSRPANQKSIGRWVYSPEQARQLWLAGFLTSGFQIDEPWQAPPQGTRILLTAKLTTTDGRTFEATHTIPVELGTSLTSVPSNKSASPVRSTTSPRAAPRILPPPIRASAVAPASYEAPAESRQVPEPEQWEFEIRPAPKRRTPPRETAFDKPARPASLPEPTKAPEKDATSSASAKPLPAGTARPFPEPANASSSASESVKTSDNWTEETLPVIR